MTAQTRPRSAGRHAIAAALASLFFTFAGCSHAESPSGSGTPTPSPKATAERYLIHGSGSASQPVKVQDIVKGRPVYVLKATDVYYSTSSSKGRFLNNTIYFYKGSTVRLTLTAPTADVNRTSYDFVLTGGVRAKSALGVTLDCDVMAYNGYTQLLTATGNVRAVDPQGDVLTGDKAVADLDLQQIHMSGHVGIGR